jgi:uncharacterized protein (TIGR02679 family)
MNWGAPDAAARRGLIRDRLGRPEYTALFCALRARLETAGGAPALTVTLLGLTEAERRAAADLHGWPTVPAGRVRISLPKLDALLRQSAVGAGLIEVLEAVGGPLADRRAEREAEVRREEQLWAQAAGHPAVQARPDLHPWLEELRRRGLVLRLARASRLDAAVLLRQALEVVARIPARGAPLSVLAAESTGDAHALDPGCPLAALVLRAAARLARWPKVPSGATARRRLWAEVGVLCDPLSANVLVLGLRPTGADRLSRHVRESADAGEPRRLTLRELAAWPVAIASAPVFVCENPVVVAAAADRLGPRCAPLVCVEGVPSTAALHLLRNLELEGAHLSFHADFDWAGLRIGNLLSAQMTAAVPWRFTARDYQAALALALASEPAPLKGSPVRAAWDPSLDAALRAEGRAVFEEQVIESLLGDLAR